MRRYALRLPLFGKEVGMRHNVVCQAQKARAAHKADSRYQPRRYGRALRHFNSRLQTRPEGSRNHNACGKTEHQIQHALVYFLKIENHARTKRRHKPGKTG